MNFGAIENAEQMDKLMMGFVTKAWAALARLKATGYVYLQPGSPGSAYTTLATQVAFLSGMSRVDVLEGRLPVEKWINKAETLIQEFSTYDKLVKEYGLSNQLRISLTEAARELAALAKSGAGLVLDVLPSWLKWAAVGGLLLYVVPRFLPRRGTG